MPSAKKLLIPVREKPKMLIIIVAILIATLGIEYRLGMSESKV